MPDYLYRFRPIESLLAKHNELENQEIYFASPGELNDPMEGFSDIFWDGDEIVWENFLRHYLVCLERAYSLLLLGGESNSIEWNHIPIIDPGDRRSVSQQHQFIQNVIFHIFTDEPIVKKYIACLTHRGPILRRELSMHLGALHQFALLVVRQVFAQHNLAPAQSDYDTSYQSAVDRLTQSIDMFALLGRMQREESLTEGAIDSIFTLTRETNAQLVLINLFNGTVDITQANKKFVLLDFSDGYLSQIERIVHPEWYAACFMSDCRNSSIWGTYGSGHTGVCLKFRTVTSDSRTFLVLNRAHAVGMDGEIRGDVQHTFHKVNYSKKHVAIDFFRSLGVLPAPIINKYWYTNEKGDRSRCSDNILKTEDDWRKHYWRNFEELTTNKLEDWDFENEYRLLLSASILDFSKSDQRKAKYDFNSLDGIVFGIKTTLETKLAIGRIIEAKCRKYDRRDFKFFQAYYSRENGSIEHYEMGLLKFKFD